METSPRELAQGSRELPGAARLGVTSVSQPGNAILKEVACPRPSPRLRFPLGQPPSDWGCPVDTHRAEAQQVGRTVRPRTPQGSLRNAWWAQSWRTPRAPTCTNLRPFPPSSTTAPTAGEPGPLVFPWAWGAGGLWGDRTVSEPLSTPASWSPEHPRAFLDTSRDSTPIRSPENRERMIQRAGFPRKVPKGSRHAPLENRGPSSRNCQSCFPLALCLLSSSPCHPPSLSLPSFLPALRPSPARTR